MKGHLHEENRVCVRLTTSSFDKHQVTVATDLVVSCIPAGAQPLSICNHIYDLRLGLGRHVPHQVAQKELV